jgi:hypothetical protein
MYLEKPECLTIWSRGSNYDVQWNTSPTISIKNVTGCQMLDKNHILA